MRHVSIRTRFLSVTWPPLKLEVTFCVRGVISPALANWYMKRMWKGWRQTGRGGEYRARVNQILRGWQAYVNCGSTAKAYRAMDEHVYDKVRHFLRRRHKVSSHGTRPFPRNGCTAPWAYADCRERWARVCESTM